MNLLKCSLSALVVIVLVVGFKLDKKSASYQEVKTQMLEFCQGVAKCETMLTAHFDTCFNDSYNMRSRRQSGGLDNGFFVECINSKGGSELLSLNH